MKQTSASLEQAESLEWLYEPWSADVDTDETQIFTVTDLKQYVFCPRIVFYLYCLPLIVPPTAKMVESKRAHDEEERREVRRSLRRYGLDEGQRHFDVRLFSPTLGLRGKTDLVIHLGQEVVPVEYKLTRRKIGRHWRLQLAAYGLMLEEMTGLTSRRGFVYSLLTRRAEEIVFTRRLKGDVKRLVAEMREMVAQEKMPEHPKRRARCFSCEFRRFCNDL